MSAKRKRGSSKKYSKAMETALEQHRDEINEETAKAKENPPTDSKSNKDDTVSVLDAESVETENVQQDIESVDATETDVTGEHEEQIDDADEKAEQADSDTYDITDADTDDSTKTVDASNNATSDSSDSDEKHENATPAVSEANNDDDIDTGGDGQSTASEDDLTDEKNDSDNVDEDEHTDTDSDASDTDNSNTVDEANTADISYADDNTVKLDDSDSDSDNDESNDMNVIADDTENVADNDNNETTNDIVDTLNDESDDKQSAEADKSADASTDVKTNEQVDNDEVTDSTEFDTASDSAPADSNVSDADADKVTIEESNDSDTNTDAENADNTDASDEKDATEAKSGGAHFASDDVTDAINDSIEQAQALVDSLTGKSKNNQDSNNDSDKTDQETVPDIGVTIKSADEIAESVIGNDDEALKKTIAKLDEMIDEETSKAAATHEQEEAAAEENADSDKIDNEKDEPKEAFTKPITDWFKNTATSIKETVSEKIAEAKETHEKAKAEKEAKAQEEQAAKEAAKEKDEKNAANASLTINEADKTDQSRNDLTAEDASEITGNAKTDATDASTTPDTTQNTATVNGTADAAANETTANGNGTNGTEIGGKKDGKEQQKSEQPQQPVNPQPYHYPSRRERRRARRAYYGYGTDAAFNRNAYHPDTNRIYAIDPKSYAKMQTPVMPDGTPIDPRRIVVIDASNAPRTLRQGVGLEAADGRYVSKKQGSGAAIAILIVAMLMSGATAAIVTGLVTGTTSSTKSVIQTVAENVNAASKQPAGEAFKNAEESVVSIYSYQATSSYGFDIFGYDPSSDKNDSNTVMSGMGSGVIINGNGDIITNAHIVNGYSDIMVKVGDKEYSAALVGKDDESDLAVIHIEGATDLKPLSFADSSKVGIGDVASTIGAPYGYNKTLSNGVISAINTNGTYETTDGMPMYIGLFQTDAVVNAQNAGGALVDSSGNLIGINVQTQGSAGGQGLSFAIPSNYAKKVADQIIESGEAQHGRIGIELRTDDSGAVAIYSVSKNSTASEAGLKAGDVILTVGGNRVKSPSDFMMAIEEQPIGEQVAIKIKRNGTEQTIKVKVEAGTVTQKITVDGKESAKG